MKNKFDISKKKMLLSDIRSLLASGKKIRLSATAITKIKKSRNFLKKEVLKKNSLIYGVNTGFGSLCGTSINKEEINTLQRNLILSHACGTGERIPDVIVKIILLLKIRSLSFGYSGVRLELIQELIDYYNNDFFPIIFEQGSLGASGDLAPLAHLALPLLGQGEVSLNGRVMSSKKALKKINKTPIDLSFKEGLALLNGTQFMTAYGIWCLLESEKLYYLSNIISSVSLEAFSCSKKPFDPLVSEIRPHEGQKITSQLILKILKGSSSFFKNEKYIQDPYSFRCIPQVHGASLDVIKHVQSVFNIEINSVTDNPNICAESQKIISAGNFHGQVLALSMDYLSLSLSELGSISERRVFKLISGERGLPSYLIDNPGLNSGFMITQYTAASIASQNKQYSTPASIDSIVSSNGQEDHVSMGANSATKLFKIVENVNTILAIELLNASQALDLRSIQTSDFLTRFLKSYRSHVPFIQSDKQLSPLIFKTKSFFSDLDTVNLSRLSY
ncbi:MAG: histidine ammonia-lyase [Flavobacteriales bacterium]|nr:histidine ammonia-lyase [Flavobacteriales bacterium]|tara:strand:+ start:493 stop:2004 length:1512 start_codon:yes stop_codon:yes gene_type:complete